MGYFSNGTEGMMYEDKWCARCVHQNGKNGDTGCHVWLAHSLHNYKECDNDGSILHLLIPRSKDHLSNEQCEMFFEGKAVEPKNVYKGRLPDYLKDWAMKHGIKEGGSV